MDESMKSQLQELLECLKSTPHLWRSPKVSVEPEKFVMNWSIAKIINATNVSMIGNFHFYGRDIRSGSGLVSSAIRQFSAASLIGVTRSGRVYQLRGLPGYSSDGDYVLRVWASGCEFEVEDATDEFIEKHGIDLKKIADRMRR